MLRTLIVDDDRDMRFLVRLTLEVANNGLSVSGEAASGAEAIASIAAERPEMVVLDNWMPGMSGLETARHILAQDPHQPIVLFSANLDPQTVAEARTLGIRGCLAKSELERLPETVRELARQP